MYKEWTVNNRPLFIILSNVKFDCFIYPTIIITKHCSSS